MEVFSALTLPEFCHNLLLNLFVWLLKFRSQPKFREWIRLEEQKNKILKAVEESSDEFPNHLFNFLSTALRLPDRYFRKASWTKIILALYKCLALTQFDNNLPLFAPTKTTKTEDEAWNYDGRVWHLYVHLIASKYGWSIEYISNLRLSVVLPLIEEILLDEQFTKEFQWAMSERSAYYDEASKSMKANPLTRPEWMHRQVEPKKLRIVQTPINMMPTGKGLTADDIIAQTPNI